MRLGEVLALRWNRVDLEGKVLMVREALEATKAGIRFKSPKSRAGRRDITLPDILVDVLREHRKAALELRMQLGVGRLPDDALLFSNLEGEPLQPSNVSSDWGELAGRVGVPEVTFHGLRHTHVSRARALAAVTRALAVKETSEAKALFVECIRNRKFTSDALGIRPLMLRALSEPWDRPMDLALPAVSLVKLNPAISHCCARASAAWPTRLKIEDLSGRLAAIADDELLRVLLETVPVCDIELERCLTGLRAILLDAAAEGPATPSEDGLLRFCSALARQCFINEYVFDTTREELEKLDRMRERLVRAM